MLTKEQIEAIEIGGRDDEWEMSGDLSMDDARELRRLALLGLEHDEEARDRLNSEVKIALACFASELGCPPLSGDIFAAIAKLKKRDSRAERIGRAVLADCALTRFAIETAIDTIRNGDGFDDDDIPKLRAIADAMEEP